MRELSYTQNFFRHPWEKTRASNCSFFLNKNGKKFSHIIDIGSGDAFLLKKIEENSVANQYSAVDIAYTPEIINEIKKNDPGSLISFYSSLKQLNISKDKSNCILLLDVLEHCENDNELLQSIIKSDLVSPETLFIITVPAFPFLFSKHDQNLAHYRRYTRKQLVSICRQNKLNIISCNYFFFSLFLIRLFQFIFEKAGLYSPKNSLGAWNKGVFLSNIFSSILWLDFQVNYLLSKTGLRLPGLSCYCICKKLP